MSVLQTEIQNELKQGKSINEICNTYRLTFKELIDICFGKRVKSNIRLPKHITKVGNNYGIIKKINRRTCRFGSYKTLEDAVTVRDNLIKFNWDKDYLPLILKQTGVEKNGN